MTDAPIVVNATPTRAQLEAALRDGLKAAGLIAATLGFEHAAGSISGLLDYVGPAAAVIGFALSQWAAYHNAKTKATLANALPNAVAVTK